MHSRIDVRPGGRHITRQNLAREVCGVLFNFHKVISVGIYHTYYSPFLTRIFETEIPHCPRLRKVGVNRWPGRYSCA